ILTPKFPGLKPSRDNLFRGAEQRPRPRRPAPGRAPRGIEVPIVGPLSFFTLIDASHSESTMNFKIALTAAMTLTACGPKELALNPRKKNADAPAATPTRTSGPFGYRLTVRYDEAAQELPLAGATCHAGSCGSFYRPDVTISAGGVDVPRVAGNYGNYALV